MPTIYRSKLFTWQGRNGKYGAHYVKVKCWSYSRKKWFYILRYNHADMRIIAGYYRWPISPPNIYYTPNSDGKKRKCSLAPKGALFYRIPYDDYVPENKVTCGRHMLPRRKIPVTSAMCADGAKWKCGTNTWRRGKKVPRYTCGAGSRADVESRCKMFKAGTWAAKNPLLFGNQCLCTWSDPKYVTKCTRQLVKNRYSHKYRAKITPSMSPSRKDWLNSRRLFSYFCHYA